MKVYKIKHKVTGLYSTGGSNPSFTKTGKAWSQIGHVKNHLRMFINDMTKPATFYPKAQVYRDCVIVVFTETQVERDVFDYLYTRARGL